MMQQYRLLRNVAASLGLLAIALLMSLGAYAQDRQVSGKVTDAGDGSAVPGVNVSVKGTTRGVTTDAEGAYRITTASDGATLVYSFVGYRSQEVPVGSQTNVDVKLVTDVTSLEEVVVTGYGTTKKKDLTGAVTQVQAKDFNSGVNTNPLQAIQGRVAGLNITQTSGDPNQSPQVRLRGITSLTGNADPLTVVDGVIGVPLNTISPNDIETIDVLKDASASAIYGSRAANGVIQITTKRGKEGRSSISYSNYFALGTIARKLPLLNGDQYREQVRRIKGDAALTGIDAGGNTDWIDEVTQQAFSQNHDLSVTGGGKGFSYRGSLSYLGQQGLIKNTGLDRINGRINVDQKALNNRLSVQYNLSFTNDTKKLFDQNIFFRSVLFLPIFPVRNADGSYFEKDGAFDLFNPVAMQNGQNHDRKERTIIGGVNLGYEVVDGLTLRVNAAYRLNNANEGRKFATGVRAYLNNNGQAERRTDETNNYLTELTANYVKAFGDVNMNLLGGYSFQENIDEGFNLNNQGFVTDALGYNNLGQGTGVIQLPSNSYLGSYRNKTRLISFFGRATFNLYDKYNLTATLRRDGSSKFGANNKWGVFPSVAAGWTISSEEFLKGVTAINFLKLRVGWGQTGNSEGLAPYGSIERYAPGASYFDGASGQWQPGYVINQNENPNLKWEVLQQTNVGLDFAFLNNRLRGTLEVYDKQTKDMLFNYSVPVPPYKTNQLQANVGQMSNQGIEFSLNYDVLQKSNFSWTVGLIGSKYATKVKTLSNPEFQTGAIRFSPFGGRGLSDVFAAILEEGKPLGQFQIPQFAGFDTKDGSMLLVKKGGGTTSKYEEAELIDGGNPQPTFTASLVNSFTYKNFDLNFLIRGVFGNKILNNTRSNFAIPGSILESNAFRSVADQPINYGVNQLSTYWLESGTFIRMDNFQLGYNVPLNSKLVSRARVFLAGQNVFLITKYTGTDPELNTAGVLEDNGRSQRPSSIGVDNRGIFPKPRTFQVGFQFTF